MLQIRWGIDWILIGYSYKVVKLQGDILKIDRVIIHNVTVIVFKNEILHKIMQYCPLYHTNKSICLYLSVFAK